MSRTLAEELLGHQETPRLPGAHKGKKQGGRTVAATLLDVRLEGFGIHTRRHVAGRLETHTFFSREAVHAALMDLWSPTIPDRREPTRIPYGSTPLWAVGEPQVLELHYGSPRGHLHATKRRAKDLSIGTMEAMVPGTTLRMALWGHPADLPPDLIEGRAFLIGKGRAPCAVIRAVTEEVEVRRGRIGHRTLPIQVANDALRGGALPGIGFRPLARSPWYTVLELAPGSECDLIEINGIRVPVLDA